MANYNYFAFTINDSEDTLAGGELAGPAYNSNAIAPEPTGMICQPDEIIKLSPGNNYSSDDDYIDFNINGDTVKVSGLTEIDWNELNDANESFKLEWFKAWMTHLGLKTFIDDTDLIIDIMSEFESVNGFQQLSGPSISYLTQNTESSEFALGVNSYNTVFWKNWIATSTNSNVPAIRKIIKSTPHFISHIAKIAYSNDTHNTWSFDNRHYYLYTGDGAENGDISAGGGNYFTEIKFAGLYYTSDNYINSQIKAKYVVKRNIDYRDPTLGLCSGEGGPFCIGDQLYIIDISILNDRIYNGTNAGFSWTWMGTATDVDRKWHIANVSKPCVDYKNVPINDMLFPLRAISECKFEDFN